MWVELVKHCHHQDRSETPKWKDHSGRGTPRGETPVEGNNGQWTLGMSIEHICVLGRFIHGRCGVTREALTSIQLGEAEALAGGVVAKLRQSQ